jgi:hypothetical protein
MRRVVAPGGVVAVCMWDRERMEMLHAINEARAIVDPDNTADVQRYRDERSIRGLLGAQPELLEVDVEYTGFDEFWSTLLGGAGPAGAWVESLDDERRAHTRDELYRIVGSPGGAFTLTGRAWAAKTE